MKSVRLVSQSDCIGFNIFGTNYSIINIYFPSALSTLAVPKVQCHVCKNPHVYTFLYSLFPGKLIPTPIPKISQMSP